jgi:hypothetical protein
MTSFHLGERTNAHTKRTDGHPLKGVVLSVRSRGVRNVRSLSAFCPFDVRLMQEARR